MAKSKNDTIQRYQTFADTWNNTTRFADIEAVSFELGKPISTVKRTVSSYRTFRTKNKDTKLPELVARTDDQERFFDGLNPKDFKGKKFFLIGGAQPGATYPRRVLQAALNLVRFREGQLMMGNIRYTKERFRQHKEFSGILRGFLKRKKIKGGDEILRKFNEDLKQASKDYGVHPDLMPYMVYDDVQLNKNLWFMPSYEVLATSKRPLMGLEPAKGMASIIVPHPKQDLEFVPRSASARMPKAMMTTGAFTDPDYRDGKAGKIAEEGHVYGFVAVEIIDNERFVFRHIEIRAKNGVFYDVAPNPDKSKRKEQPVVVVRCSPEGVEVVKDAVDTCVWGDYHVTQTSKRVRRILYGTTGIVRCLKPKVQVFHDFLDSHSISHHHERQASVKVNKAEKGHNSLQWELDENVAEIDFIRDSSPDTEEFVFVASNHNEHVDRYLDEDRYLKEPHNQRIGHKLMLGYLDGKNPLAYYVSEKTKMDRLLFLSRDDDYFRCGVKLDQHGDVGANGARGSMPHFARHSGRMIKGHDHKGGKRDQVFGVGTCTPLKLEYTKGETSWTNTQAVIFKNGQIMLFVIVDDHWHGLV